jgi:UDPglucose--hexose-1-phosphate uridylyltransferase
MVTTELRRDPITGRHVIIDRLPSPRRDEFDLESSRVEDRPADCLLCEGREAEIGAEILAWREGGPANMPGWSVRVVPHPQPMLRIEGGMAVSDGAFEVRDGLGAHEVIVETPLHDQALQALDPDHLWRVLWAWRTRVQDLKRDTRFASIIIFKNHGRAAGARVDHAHSNLVACPIIPPALAEKVGGAARHLQATGRCLFCDLQAAELADGRRVIGDDGDMVALAPFASRVPFETWLLPRAHRARFEDTSDEGLKAMAATLKAVLERMDWALERPAYNVTLYTAPLSGAADAGFHWHIEILPRVTRYGGLEWASGLHRNPVAPEHAAEAMRQRT